MSFFFFHFLSSSSRAQKIEEEENSLSLSLTLSTGAKSPCLPYSSTSIIPATTGEIEKGRSKIESNAGFHRNSLRAISNAAATPQTVLMGTAQHAIKKVIFTA